MGSAQRVRSIGGDQWSLMLMATDGNGVMQTANVAFLEVWFGSNTTTTNNNPY